MDGDELLFLGACILLSKHFELPQWQSVDRKSWDSSRLFKEDIAKAMKEANRIYSQRDY